MQILAQTGSLSHDRPAKRYGAYLQLQWTTYSMDLAILTILLKEVSLHLFVSVLHKIKVA